MLRLLAKIVGPLILNRELKVQSNLGYKLVLTGSPLGWIDGFMIANMEKTWRLAGLACKGLNYFTLGEVKNGLSTRFQPNDPMYQAWLGSYIVKFDEVNSWTPQECLRLCQADQNKWLKHFGDPAPKMEFEAKEEGSTFYWVGKTHSDVGPQAQGLHTRALMEGMAGIMNKLNPALSLTGTNFLPSNLEIAYQDVALHGYLKVVEIDKSTKVVLYVAGTKLEKNSLKKLLQKVHLERLTP